jgi:hypothetical protein
MTGHIDYPSTYKKREREEVVKKNEHDSSKPPASEGRNQYSPMSWKNQADFNLFKV